MVSRLAAVPYLRDFTLHAYDGTTPVGEIDIYEEATFTARFNAVSAWEIVLPTATDGCQALLAASRPRLIVRWGDQGTVFRSGPPIDFTREIDNNGDMTTITGVDDLVWLARRLAHPQPGTAAPPYSTTAYDVRTGPASQVIAAYVNANAGPGAVAARRVPDLAVPTPAAMGGTITRQLRYQNLLAEMALIADGAGLGIEVVDLEFRVYQPTGLAVFSVELGSLAGSTSAYTAPDANYVYVGGSGEGTARVIVEVSDTDSITEWGRAETFVDQRQTSVPADLTSKGNDVLTEEVTRPSVEMEAVDTEGQQFGVDWGLGSLARVYLDPGGDPFEQVIREVKVELRGNRPPIIRPTLGGTIDPALWARMSSTEKRVRQLEVR
jgi:hypothetical protein